MSHITCCYIFQKRKSFRGMSADSADSTRIPQGMGGECKVLHHRHPIQVIRTLHANAQLSTTHFDVPNSACCHIRVTAFHTWKVHWISTCPHVECSTGTNSKWTTSQMFAFIGDRFYTLSPIPSGRIFAFTSVKTLFSPLYLLSQASLHVQTSPIYLYTYISPWLMASGGGCDECLTPHEDLETQISKIFHPYVFIS